MFMQLSLRRMVNFCLIFLERATVEKSLLNQPLQLI
jgi:hypothetical protein